MIEKFSESLSRKSLPTGAANILQAKPEQKIKSNHFADFTYSNIPPSGVWVQQKINRLKQQNKFIIEGFVNNFIANITEHQQSLELKAESSSSNSFSSLNSDQTNAEILIDTEDSAEKDYRTVSRSLKRVIHIDFDYNSFLRHMEELQKECSLCSHGLSQATGLFTESVISGAIFPTNPELYFDYSCIGLTELTAHVGQKQIAILNQKLVEKLFQSADTATNVEKAITGMNPPSLDVRIFSLEYESELEDEEDLVVTSSSNFDDVKAVTLDYAQKDLTAKEVRALSAVFVLQFARKYTSNSFYFLCKTG
ncbi:hypothetical protein INT47_010965 [Mucor saturninus]|uniref:Uncharacterized protein n=1 Tax=Mucor saturninus TaxID=64648 RepID=A0A8H7V2Q8_9FUNG|nr:hypothetical protein INT47_010965 [Mucor saturninus]